MVMGKTGNCMGETLESAHVSQEHPGMKREPCPRHCQPALGSAALTRHLHLDIKLKCAYFQKVTRARADFSSQITGHPHNHQNIGCTFRPVHFSIFRTFYLFGLLWFWFQVKFDDKFLKVLSLSCELFPSGGACYFQLFLTRHRCGCL